MKKLTLEKVESAKIGDFFKLKDGKIYSKHSNERIYIEMDLGARFLDFADLGIEIIKPAPEITQENLCKFRLKYGEWPSAIFFHDDGSKARISTLDHYELCDTNGPVYTTGGQDNYYKCEIIDERWPDLLKEE